MARAAELLGLALSLLALAGCSRSPSTGGSATTQLDPQTAAQVGSERISVQTVTRIASAQGVSAHAAVDHAIEDTLLAIRARSELPPYVSLAQLQRTALAQALLRQLNTDARAQGPAKDDEVRAAIKRRWWDLDRPEMFRTTHAVVIVEKPEQETTAREVAEVIAQSVVGTTNADEFRKQVETVDKRGLNVKVEDLPPVAADGRTVDPLKPPPPGTATGTFDPVFSAAASALTKVGQLSPIVRSKFGFHVILLTQHIAAQQSSFDHLRQQLSEEIYENRARTALDALLKPLRAAANITLVEQAAALTGLVRVVQ